MLCVYLLPGLGVPRRCNCNRLRSFFRKLLHISRSELPRTNLTLEGHIELSVVAALGFMKVEVRPGEAGLGAPVPRLRAQHAGHQEAEMLDCINVASWRDSAISPRARVTGCTFDIVGTPGKGDGVEIEGAFFRRPNLFVELDRKAHEACAATCLGEPRRGGNLRAADVGIAKHAK